MHTERSTADFGVPDEKAWSKFFAVDFHPASWINQETEHVLFTTVQSCSSLNAVCGGRKSVANVTNNFQQFRIPQACVGHACEVTN